MLGMGLPELRKELNTETWVINSTGYPQVPDGF